jgi:hypothetical protein
MAVSHTTSLSGAPVVADAPAPWRVFLSLLVFVTVALSSCLELALSAVAAQAQMGLGHLYSFPLDQLLLDLRDQAGIELDYLPTA